MNKELVVENRRLAILHRLLLLAAILAGAVNMSQNRTLDRHFMPHARGFEIWSTGPSEDTPESCNSSQLERYNYVHSQNFVYAPTRCATLGLGEGSSKVAGTLDFPTYVQDTHFQRQYGQEACSHTLAYCNERNGTYREVGEACSCEVEEQFIVQRAEYNTIWLNHGFQVAMDLDGMQQQVGRTMDERVKSLRYSGHGDTKETELEDGILTIIKRPDGSECMVGGKARWLPQETIHGTLQEWLLCGGWSLDDASSSLRASRRQQTSPRLRIAGASLELTLRYSNYETIPGFRGIVCSLIVHAIPVWNSFTDLQYMVIPDTSQPSSPSTYRYRYAYGVSVRMNVEGSFGFLEGNMFFTALMAHLFLLTMPRRLVTFVANYGAGLASCIYIRAQKETVDIRQEFCGFCTRLMGHAQCFASLANDSDPTGHKIHLKDLRRLLLEAFQTQKVSSNLPIDQVSRLSHVVLLGCDPDSDNTITQKEYVYAASRNEILHMDEAMAFFDYTRRKSLLERIFGDDDFDPISISRTALSRQASWSNIGDNREDEDDIKSKNFAFDENVKVSETGAKAAPELADLKARDLEQAIQISDLQRAVEQLRVELQQSLLNLEEQWALIADRQRFARQPPGNCVTTRQDVKPWDTEERTTEVRRASERYETPPACHPSFLRIEPADRPRMIPLSPNSRPPSPVSSRQTSRMNKIHTPGGCESHENTIVRV